MTGALGNGSAEGGNMGGDLVRGGINQLKPIFGRHMGPRAAYQAKPASPKHYLGVLSFHKLTWEPLRPRVLGVP